MDDWLIAVFGFGALVLALRLWTGPAPQRPRHPSSGAETACDGEQLWTPDALARLGTPDSVADLVAQGRADELRGLGYGGELPPED